MTQKVELEHRRMANARERKRMKLLNVGFEHLRQRLPSMFHEKRLSKVETLKSAIEYISKLQAVLDQTNRKENPETRKTSSLTTTFPTTLSAYQKKIWTPPILPHHICQHR